MIHILSKLKALKTNKSGAALVEFSILLPVLFLMILGMMEFSRVIYQHHVAEKGVKNAARYLARIADTSGCAMSGGDFSTAQADAKSLAQKGKLTGGTASLSNWADPASISVTVSCETNAGEWRGTNNIPVITVSTAFSYNDLGLLGVLNTSPITIRASHQEMFIGG